MVSPGQTCAAIGHWLLAQQEQERLIERLEPMDRARVLLLLLFVVILGVGLMLFAWLWGRVTRRNLRRAKMKEHSLPNADDWANAPLVKPDDGRGRTSPDCSDMP